MGEWCERMVGWVRRGWRGRRLVPRRVCLLCITAQVGGGWVGAALPLVGCSSWRSLLSLLPPLLLLNRLNCLPHCLLPLQMGADSVVRSLARRALEIVGEVPGGASVASNPSNPSSSGGSGGSFGGAFASQPLMGTPHEPYASPVHPSARPDTTPSILAGTPLEQYANPSPQWHQAAGAAAAALAKADRQLPPSAGPSSALSNRGGSGGGASTAAAAAGAAGQASGLGPSPRVQPLLQRLRLFMEEHVYPAGEGARGGLPCRWGGCEGAAACAAFRNKFHSFASAAHVLYGRALRFPTPAALRSPTAFPHQRQH